MHTYSMYNKQKIKARLCNDQLLLLLLLRKGYNIKPHFLQKHHQHMGKSALTAMRKKIRKPGPVYPQQIASVYAKVIWYNAYFCNQNSKVL